MFRKAISHLLSALLLASVALLPTLARADPNADCNRSDGADSLASTDDDSLECGEEANASGGNATALGSQAQATGDFSLALGDRAAAIADGSTAAGQFAQAGSDADHVNASAFGRSAQAVALGATAVGAGSDARGDNSTALGTLSIASGNDSIAAGRLSQATGGRAIAIGRLAEADFAGSTALGANARTTEENQVMIGGSGTSVAIGDLAASTAAQVGPVDVVTVDANGTLGRQQVATAGSVDNVRTAMNALAMVSEAQFDQLSTNVAALDSRVAAAEFALEELDERSRGGIAAAMAMGGMMVVPDSKVSFSASVSTFEGEQGFAGGISARLAERVYISASVAGSTAEDSTGGRVGVAFGF